MEQKLWSDNIPKQIKLEISKAVEEQIFDLPVNLFIEWQQPICLEKRWFVEASKYIDIPYYTDYFKQ